MVRKDGSVPRVAQWIGASKQWVWKWWRRFKEGGYAALEDRSSRPHRIHARRHLHVEEILAAKKKHPHLGAVKLKIVAQLPLSHDTIHRVLQEHGACRRVKRPWRKYRRFQRPYPNYLWQLDITQIPSPQGWIHIATLVDDHSRFILASQAYEKDLNQGDVVGLVRRTIERWGTPRQILTDRGTQFHSEQSDEPSLFTRVLHALGVQHIKARPRHPRTLGKIERWHRSVKHEWFAFHQEPAGLEEARRILSGWLEHYNFERPHWSLGLRTPGEVYLATFKFEPELARAVNGVS